MKKTVISLILAISILLTSSGSILISALENSTWDGTAATAFAGGTGTETDPYQIANAAQLKYFSELGTSGNKGKHFILTDDIYYNDISAFNEWSTNAPDNVWKPFSLQNASFDGKGHTIYGLYVNGAANAGFLTGFSWVQATLKVSNLGFENCYFSGTNASLFGILAGNADLVNSALISKCFVDNSVFGSTGNSINYSAAFFTSVNSAGAVSANIINCYAGAGVKIFGGGISGGIYADTWSNGAVSISNTYSAADVSATVSGGIFGKASMPISCTNVYTTSSNAGGSSATYTGITAGLTLESITGNNARTTLLGFNFDTVWKIVEGKTPTLLFSDTGSWDGTPATTFNGGIGTESDPYQIATASQLMYFSSLGTSGNFGKHYILTADIYFNDIKDFSNWETKAPVNTWKPVSLQNGSFNGNGHIIYGLYVNGAANAGFLSGLSWVNANLKVSNLGFQNCYFNGTNASLFGIIAGNADLINSALISKCFVDNSVFISTGSSTNYSAAFFTSVNSVGVVSANITNCYAGAGVKISGNGISGGIYADTWSNGAVSISNTYSAADVSATVSGGIFGKASMPISCTNVYTTSSNAGGSSATYTGITAGLTLESITGNNAPTTLIGFDFGKIWQTVEGKTPALIYSDSWDGTAASSFAGGTGTEEDPYQIATAAQLMYFSNRGTAENKGKHFILTQDIYFNDISNYDNWDTTAPENIWKPFSFRNGSFNGAGHTIFGLYVNGVDNAGFLTGMSWVTATLKVCNVGFENCYFCGTNASLFGIIAGNADLINSALISKCFVDNSVFISTGSSTNYSAAFFTSVNSVGVVSANITNCYAGAGVKISGNGISGGIYADTWSNGAVSISNTYSAADVSATVSGGIFGKASMPISCTNVYTTSSNAGGSSATYTGITAGLTIDSITGDNARTTLLGFNFDTVWKIVEGKTPTLLFSDTGSWDGTPTTTFNGGIGTESDPYQIATASQLMYFSSLGTSGNFGKHYILTADIYFNDIKDFSNWETKTPANAWKPFSFRNGSFNGAGHTIYGLYVNGATNAGFLTGLSWVNSELTICNLGFENCYFKGVNASLFGTNIGNASYVNKTYVRKCFADNCCFISTGDANSSGSVCYAATFFTALNSETTITNCYVGKDVTVSGVDITGGIFADTWTAGSVTIKKVYSAAKVEGPKPAGICGKRSVSITASSVYTTMEVLNISSSKAEYEYTGITGNLNLESIFGDNAKDVLNKFDFESIWITVEGSTPKLRQSFGLTDDCMVDKNAKLDAFIDFENYPYVTKSTASRADLANEFNDNGRMKFSEDVNHTENGKTSLTYNRLDTYGVYGNLILHDADDAPLILTPGKEYEASFWIYVENAGNSISVKFDSVWIDSCWSTNQYSVPQCDPVVISSETATVGEWRKYYLSFEYSPFSELAIFNGIALSVQTFGIDAKYYIDDIEIEEIVYDPNAIRVTFDTNGGTPIDRQVGAVGAPIDLSVIPQRENYEFVGWYSDIALTVPFTSGIFADKNMILYAKWDQNAFYQDFEQYPYTVGGQSGMTSGIEIYRPGAYGYTASMILSGKAAIHTLGNSQTPQSFSVFQSDTGALTPGNTYEVSCYVFIKKLDSLDKGIKVLYENQCNNTIWNCGNADATDLGNVPIGSWQKIKFNFVAKTKYIGITVPGASEIFFDDFAIIYTGKKASYTVEPLSLGNENPAQWIFNKFEFADEEIIPDEEPIIEDDILDDRDSIDSDDDDDDEEPTVIRKVIRRRKIKNKTPLALYIGIGTGAVLLAGAGAFGVTVLVKKKKKQLLGKKL